MPGQGPKLVAHACDLNRKFKSQNAKLKGLQVQGSEVNIGIVIHGHQGPLAKGHRGYIRMF